MLCTSLKKAIIRENELLPSLLSLIYLVISQGTNFPCQRSLPTNKQETQQQQQRPNRKRPIDFVYYFFFHLISFKQILLAPCEEDNAWPFRQIHGSVLKKKYRGSKNLMVLDPMAHRISGRGFSPAGELSLYCLSFSVDYRVLTDEQPACVSSGLISTLDFWWGSPSHYNNWEWGWRAGNFRLFKHGSSHLGQLGE